MIRWRQYRSDGASAPLAKVALEAKSFFEREGCAPQVIGVPPSFPEADRAKLAERFKVLVCVPAWARNEIWLGVDL